MVMTIVAAVIGLVLGTGVGYALWQSAMKKKGALMIAEAKKEAEQIKKDRILEAKREIPKPQGGARKSCKQARPTVGAASELFP